MANEIEEGTDGLYSLCVFNAGNTTDNEINEIFGKFGEIVRINRTPGNLVFVRYRMLEAARQCFENMQGNGRFNVKPGKKKGVPNNSGRDNRVGEMSRFENSRGRRPETSGSGDFGQRSSSSVARPPKLIPFPGPDPKSDETQSNVKAKMLVIGNLNPKMGQNNVYDLCIKCNVRPLHVAMKMAKRPPYPALSYALVYVRNDAEVKNLIKSLNYLKLFDYHLIVSSVEQLTEEGKAMLSAK